jgi:hypothetical protein
MVWTRKENVRKQISTENFRMGTRGMQRRGRPKERRINSVRRSTTNHGLTEEDTRDKRQMAKLSFG